MVSENCLICNRVIDPREFRLDIRFYHPTSELDSPIIICNDCLVSFTMSRKVDTAERLYGASSQRRGKNNNIKISLK